MRSVLLIFAVSVGVLVHGGCAPAKKDKSEKMDSASTAADKKVTPPVELATPLKVADYDGLIKKHQGKVVIADFWFRGCPPCEAAMPHLAELQAKHSDQLVVMTFAIDDPGKKRDGAVKFLKEKKFNLASYVIHDGETEDDWAKAFKLKNKDWELAQYPTTFIFDRDGKVVKFLEGEGNSFDDIKTTVAKLLDKGAAPKTSSSKLSNIFAQPVAVADFEGLVKKHKGKVVVADFWFSTCGPCLRAMPHLAELQNKYADNLVIMTFAIDDPGEKRDLAVKILKKGMYPFATYVIGDKESEEDWTKKFDLGIYPTTLVYDRAGSLAKRFQGGEDEEAVLSTITKLANNEPLEPEKKAPTKKEK